MGPKRGPRRNIAIQPTWTQVWNVLLRNFTSFYIPIGDSERRKRTQRIMERQKLLLAQWETKNAEAGMMWPVRHVNLLAWLKYAAWGKCKTCGILYTRKLIEVEVMDQDLAKSKVSNECNSCAGRVKNKVRPPSLDSHPLCLRNLLPKQWIALRPIMLSQGEPKKHAQGYRRRDKLSACSWSVETVEEKILKLDLELQGPTKEAYEWLLANGSSSYGAWIAKHHSFLTSKKPEESFRLLFDTVLEPYIEGALWPHLYPTKELCESKILAPEDWEPLRKKGRKKIANASHESMKAQYVAKLTCDLAAYASHYDLLQFQFDRHIFRTVLGSMKHGDIDTDQANEHRHWCPNYWMRYHNYLKDIVRQLGQPQLFLTIAPWEFDFPWPYWVDRLHEAAKMGPTDMGGVESLAIAHALHQFCSAYLAGFGPNRKWKANLFADRDLREANVEAYLGRFEFQEGGKEHAYGKGRGSLHIHLLFWFRKFSAIGLAEAICAEFLEGDPELCMLAERVQVGIEAEPSRAPRHEGRSTWFWSDKAEAWAFLARHTSEYAAAALRPFLIPVLRIFRCHSDVQWWDGAGALLRYCVGYVSKYNEAWDALALKEDLTPWGAAMMLLQGWKAAEAEMTMVLAKMPMVFTNFVGKEYNPRFYGVEADEELHLYRCRHPDHEGSSMIAWLRCHTITGTLVDRTARAKPHKRKKLYALAIRYKKWTDDRFFWQWLVMNKPHRQWEELQAHGKLRVSNKVQHFARALLECPGTWDSPEWVRNYFAAEGHKTTYVDSCNARVRALCQLVKDQISGKVAMSIPPIILHTDRNLSPKQQEFMALCLQDYATREEWRRSIANDDSSDDESHESPEVLASLLAKARYLSGGPGSGKTYNIIAICKLFTDKGIQVLYATPTGKLAVSLPKFQNLVATTLNRAFGIGVGTNRSTWGNDQVGNFELWIIDEISMVSKDVYEHIMQQWLMAGRVPLLLFVGDFHQLPPIIKSGPIIDARNSKLWKSVLEFDLGACASYRTNDRKLLDFQATCRVSIPSEQECIDFFGPITLGDDAHGAALIELWREMPTAVTLTAKVQTSAEVNELAIEYFGEEFLGVVDVWQGDGLPQTQKLFRNTRVRLTSSIDFDAGMVNGLDCRVLEIHAGGIEVQLENGEITIIWRTSREFISRNGKFKYRRSAYEIILAYATTVHQAEGQSIDHVCIIFEDWCPPGWAYTAITRAKAYDHLRVIGNPQPRHFVPRG
jgi:hypothetical protein